jgi:transmembrane sensor
MNGTSSKHESVPSARVRAQAAAWLAETHAEPRNADVDARLRAWLAESEDHRHAFDRLTRAWEQAGAIRLRARDPVTGVRTRPRFVPWSAAAAMLILAAGIAFYYSRIDALATGIGQQRVQLLPDGTRVELNTDTRIEVHYDAQARRVRLIHGEAWFEVSKHPTWPFLVSADDHVIRALGTSFIVRQDKDDLSVTLVEGQVSVAPTAQSGPQDAQLLTPGQRLVISPHDSTVDRPDLPRITAWRHGRVQFDATPLAEAAAEMNRYNKTRVVLADADLARLRIGGVFRAGDSDEFVRVVSTAFGLRADKRGGEIVLSRSSSPPPG